MSARNQTNGLAEKYAVIAALGQGGMSVIHLAVTRGPANVRKLVVLKSIRTELFENEQVRQMFMDEARLSTRLNHPNIVQAFEVALIEDRPVLVLEYMEGQSFSSFLRKAAGGCSLGMQLHILNEALAGLDHAHNLSDYDGTPIRLVHRDVSPQNVFVTYDGHVKILDFGIAKAAANAAHTELGQLKGKIRYMAPEQMEGAATLDRRADVFAVGVMLWEALAKKRLWAGTADVEVLQIVINKGIPSPKTVNPDVEPRLEAICMKALARAPDERYQSCALMLADLEQAAYELGLRSSSKEIGRLLARLFEETRTSIRAAIERKLKVSESQPPARTADAFLDAGELLSRSASGNALVPATADGVTVVIQPKPRLPRVLAVLCGSLLILGVAFAIYLYAGPPAPAPAARKPLPPAPIASNAAVAPSAAVPRVVAVRLSASPNRAKLYLDNKPVGKNPFLELLPTDTAPHQFRAEAGGFVTQSVTIWLTSATSAELKLAAEPKGASSTLPKSVTRAPVVTHTRIPTSPSVTPVADCKEPFSIDAAGIRHVRAECM